MSAPKLLRATFVIVLIVLFVSCDVAGGLFSESELADMYDIWINKAGQPLSDGDLVVAGSSLVPVIESHGDIGDPERLSLVLVDMDGYEAARLGFVAESALLSDEDKDASLRAVRSVSGSLPSFTLPAGLSEGYYYLQTKLFDATGRSVHDSSILLLLYNGELSAPRIEIFPSSPAKDQTVFLRLVSELPDGLDPWLRWYIGGLIRKEGFASDFADRLIWHIPEEDGFLSVRAELFPFKPPEEVKTRSGPENKPYISASRADLILAVGPAQPASPLASLDHLYGMDFKSEPESLMLKGPDGNEVPALMLGVPYLESHAHGYGHALGTGSGYMISGSILPPPRTAFNLSVVFDPVESTDATGSLVSLYSQDGSLLLLRLGVSGGVPYMEAGDRFVQATTGITSGLSRFVLEIIPPEAETGEYIVTLFLDAEAVAKGSLPVVLLEQMNSVTALIGGPEGLAAVYDEFAVIPGRHQAFFIAKALEFGPNLIAAGGFEGGNVGMGIGGLMTDQLEDGYAELSADSNLEIQVPSTGFTAEFEGEGAPLDLLLVMDDGSVLSLFEGEQLQSSDSDKDALVRGSPPWGSDQKFSLSVEAVSGSLRISDNVGRSGRLSVSQKPATLRIRATQPGLSILHSLMVRQFSSMDAVNRSANISTTLREGSGN